MSRTGLRLTSRTSSNECKIFIEGKTIKQLCEESGICESTIRRRLYRGANTVAELTKPLTNRNGVSLDRRIYYIGSASKRVYEACLEQDIGFTELSRRTGISRSCISSFVYDGKDISSCRLAKICGVLGLSMDYVMGMNE